MCPTLQDEEQTTVYTVGHSNHGADEFITLLHQHGIELVADVRSSPYSRYVPQANREILSHALRAAGIVYHWLGDRLGGKPDGEVGDYDKLRTSPAFQKGITDLLALASEHRTVIMCSEGDHRLCHRHKLITPILVEQGVHVVHIQPDGTFVDEDKEPRQLALF